MKQAANIANTLIEAMPHMQRLSGQVVVIKYGGNAMVDEELKHGFAKDMALLKQVGVNPVVVHGGGPQIGRVLQQLGKKSEFIDGMRVTDAETMDVVEMVLAGRVNKEIVANINRAGGRAIGLSGKDAGLICARKMHLERNHPAMDVPELIDIGHVGRVHRINTDVLRLLEQDRFIPVIAPVGFHQAENQSYNINADYVASAVARALGASKLILLTDVTGVLDREGKLCSSLRLNEVQAMIDEGVIAGGMIPKVRCCMEAICHGGSRARIIDGRLPHAVLLELFTDAGIGTMFRDV